MATLLGILVDVSGSMEESVGDRRNRRGGEWARANFELVNDLIKHDVSSSNHVFALGCGGRYEPVAFDLLNTLEKANTPSVSDGLTLEQTLDRILTILEGNGAPRVRIWGKMNVLLSVVDEIDAKLFLDRLENDNNFKRRFVHDCLPKECRHLNVSFGEAGFGLLRGAGAVGNFFGVGDTEQLQGAATKSSVREAIDKGKRLLSELTFVRIGSDAVMDVHKARTILHGRIKKDDLTDERVDELMDKIRPFIYGRTPLMATLNHAQRLFAVQRFKEYDKLLFILSDGIPTDGQSPPIAELAALGVKTVCCYITSDSIQDPKRLYSRWTASGDSAADLMFRMSSKITTQLIPRTIFVKRGWKIDIEDNETRLFFQVNHPDILDDVCDLARDVVCCQDSLSDLLSSIDLDLYINKANQGFVPKEQVGGTCYANATAAVLHLSMKRIIGRDGGVPDFFPLRDEIIAVYGRHGANTFQVLREVCPKYRLQCKEVDVRGALKAITGKRPVVAKFRLTDAEWDIFSNFYRRNPSGILSGAELGIRRPTRERLSGHAVVLTSFNSQCLRLMNSWGDSWADGGFFRVSDAGVLGLEFVDVYWTISDLKQSEKNAYDSHGADVAQKLIARLKGLQMAKYKCPKCHQVSGLGEFTGHALETTCPKCRSTFRIENPGEDIALNLYLLSLSTPTMRTGSTGNHDIGDNGMMIYSREALN